MMNEIFFAENGRDRPEGLNRRRFEDRLTANVSRRLHKFGRFRIYARQSTVYVEPLEDSCDMDGAWEAIQPVFGIAGLSRAGPATRIRMPSSRPPRPTSTTSLWRPGALRWSQAGG